METSRFRLLNNGFESQTRDSHKKAISLSTDTTDKLRVSTNTFLVDIYNEYLPFHDAYIALNLAVEISEGTYKGKTANFENIMGGLGEKLRLWEPPVRAIFPEDSAVEIEIFPNKRNPFYEGTYEQRLLAVKALRDKLLEFTAAHTPLVPVQADVAAFYTLANTARQVQQGKEGEDGDLRAQREVQRVTTMNAFWGMAYAGLLHEYRETPARIAEYIDFGLLYDYSTEELLDTVTVAPGNTVVNVPLADVAVTGATKFRLKNISEVTGSIAKVYFAPSPTGSPVDSAVVIITLNPGDNRLVTAAELGYNTGRIFLNIFNSTGVEVQVEVWEVR